MLNQWQSIWCALANYNVRRSYTVKEQNGAHMDGLLINQHYFSQKNTYDKLKNKKGHGNDCGRPGINGGFIKNQNVRFGVNCYGYKPEITPQEKQWQMLMLYQ